MEDNPAHTVRASYDTCVSWLGVSTVLPWLEGGNNVTRPGHFGLQEWLDRRDQAYFDDLNAHFDELLNQD